MGYSTPANCYLRCPTVCNAHFVVIIVNETFANKDASVVEPLAVQNPYQIYGPDYSGLFACQILWTSIENIVFILTFLLIKQLSILSSFLIVFIIPISNDSILTMESIKLIVFFILNSDFQDLIDFKIGWNIIENALQPRLNIFYSRFYSLLFILDSCFTNWVEASFKRLIRFIAISNSSVT